MKPCPFCGCRHLHTFSHHYCGPLGATEERRIQCLMCRAEAPTSIWDTRLAPEPAPAARSPADAAGAR